MWRSDNGPARSPARAMPPSGDCSALPLNNWHTRRPHPAQGQGIAGSWQSDSSGPCRESGRGTEHQEARNVASGAPRWLLRQLIRNLEHVVARWLELDLSAEEFRRNSLHDTPSKMASSVEVTGGAVSRSRASDPTRSTPEGYRSSQTRLGGRWRWFWWCPPPTPPRAGATGRTSPKASSISRPGFPGSPG